jgi:mRNA-degrading endonuclease RelE of RelBE toxin-antitoxin system
VFSSDAEAHLQTLTARQRALVWDKINHQLVHEPTVETRNRKPMRPNPLASWELRVENLRVYYRVQEEPQSVVIIRGVGVKHRHQVLVGGKAFKL